MSIDKNEVIDFLVMEGMKPSEIAKIAGCPNRAVWNRKYLLLRRIPLEDYKKMTRERKRFDCVVFSALLNAQIFSKGITKEWVLSRINMTRGNLSAYLSAGCLPRPGRQSELFVLMDMPQCRTIYDFMQNPSYFKNARLPKMLVGELERKLNE